MTRRLHYACPDCPAVETVTLPDSPHFNTADLPPEQTIQSRCNACFSAKLDLAYPGARERQLRLRGPRSATGKKGPRA